MITRALAALAALAAVAALSLAVAPLGAQQSRVHDPDIKAGGGVMVRGWHGRTDDTSAKLSDARFVTSGKGYRVTSGPAAIYWNAGQVANGPFTAAATFTQLRKPAHPEGYGLLLMGHSLEGVEQNYAYVLVRGDGKVLVNHRAGGDIHKIIPWTDDAAIHREDARGRATNTITVDALRPDSLRMLVNGKQVAAIAKEHLGSTDGQVGIRVNHNLDVQVSKLGMSTGRR